MKIESITIKSFRCFKDASTILLSDTTAFIGSNGTGKTAVLQALQKLFGTTSAEREIQRSDFHIPPRIDPDSVSELTLQIEVRISFPELNGAAPPTVAVAECFQHMVLEREAGDPFCRVRLESTWSRGTLPEGDIDTQVYWITTAAETVGDADKQVMKPHERSRIHLLYVPASRDPSRQLRNVSGSVLARLLTAITWSEDAKNAVEEASQQVRTAFDKEAAIERIHAKVSEIWNILQDMEVYARPQLRPLGDEVEDLLRQIEMVFQPGEHGNEHALERLSEGLRSLFYMALVSAVVELEHDTLEASRAAKPGAGTSAPVQPVFSLDRLCPPSLTIIAIEEPENHLSPHYLGRIMTLLERMGRSPTAQVVLTSHSPAILKRLDPTTVRHLRLDKTAYATIVREVKLPAEKHAAYKYVKQAVLAYPELYFAKLVVLAEGDSEEIVLSHILRVLVQPLDPSFVSVVPLGGRHVNHFWRLLDELSIPFITLLDLDRERWCGGWARVKYVLKQLLAIGADSNQLLAVEKSASSTGVLSLEELEGMHRYGLATPQEVAVLDGWTARLEQYDVFLAAPLDLDLMMLLAFPAEYQAAAGADEGPDIPSDPTEKEARIVAAVKTVLKEKGGSGTTYDAAIKALFPWYSYLFLGKGKPSTHLLALSALTDEAIRSRLPGILNRLVTRIGEKLKGA